MTDQPPAAKPISTAITLPPYPKRWQSREMRDFQEAEEAMRVERKRARGLVAKTQPPKP